MPRYGIVRVSLCVDDVFVCVLQFCMLDAWCSVHFFHMCCVCVPFVVCSVLCALCCVGEWCPIGRVCHRRLYIALIIYLLVLFLLVCHLG